MTSDRKIIEQFGYRRSPDQDRARARAPSRRSSSARARSAWRWRSIWRSAASTAAAARRRRPHRRRQPRHLLGQAHARDLRPARRRRADARARASSGRRARCSSADAQVYDFDLLPEGGHQMPAFINLQQYYVEQELVRAHRAARPTIELRWRNRVTGIAPRSDGAIVTIETPDGPYRLACDWLVCCDGARSPCRDMLGLGFKGEAFEDRFLIADVEDDGGVPDRALVLVRSAVPLTASRRCCTSSPTTSGASTCSSGPMPTRRPSARPSASSRASSACWAIAISSWNGCRSTPSSAAGSSASCTAA